MKYYIKYFKFNIQNYKIFSSRSISLSKGKNYFY